MTRGTRWLIAGVVALVLLGAAGVVTLLALDSGDDAEQASAPAAPTTTRAEFGPAPDLCRVTEHFAPVFDIVPMVATPRDTENEVEGLYQRGCIFRLDAGSSLGHLTVTVRLYDSPQNARNGYRETLASAAGLAQAQGQAREELDGDWDEGAVLSGASASEAAVQAIAMADALLVSVSCDTVGDAPDVAALRAATVRVADNIREAMRR